MHYIYIIYSPQFDKYYVGETVDMDKRLKEHNTHFYSTSSTKFTDDWKICKVIIVQNCQEARKIESYIKSMKSKKFINNLISDESYYSNFKTIVLEKFNIGIKD